MKLKIGIILSSFLLVLGCTTPMKAGLDSSNPQEAVKNIEKLKNDLIESSADVLAKNVFKRGDEKLNDAIESIRENEDRKEIISSLEQSKAYFLEAKKIAETKKIIPNSVMDARQSAIDAKISSNQDLRDKLDTIDDELRDKTEKFTVALSSDELSTLQTQYLKLEIEAIQHDELGTFRRIVKEAKDSRAEVLAPNTFKDANSQMKIAENLINQSPRNPSLYYKSVERANKSVKLLADVMNQLSGDGRGSSEGTALKLVYQERKLGKLSDKVVSLQDSLVTTNDRVGAMNSVIDRKNNEILSSENQVRFQNAMNKVRNSFNEKEADVYQQGEKLIIRIKEISFKSGSATIPTNSMNLLSKINSIVTELGPKEVVIEGHTDSTGAQNSNMMLSNERAKAVKQYLSSLDANYPIDSRGFGESKPIANNETKEGRFLNRRVDIVVKANQ